MTFLYVDHQEYAEVGVQHIVPFINTLAEYVSAKAETAVNPDKVIPKFITSRKDAPTGSKENIFDGDESTSAVYKTPNSLSKDDYIGVEYNKVIDIDSIRFLLGGGKDHFEHAKTAVYDRRRNMGRSDVDRHGKQFCRRIR